MGARTEEASELYPSSSTDMARASRFVATMTCAEGTIVEMVGARDCVESGGESNGVEEALLAVGTGGGGMLFLPLTVDWRKNLILP